MSTSFKTRLLEAYRNDDQWKKILQLVQKPLADAEAPKQGGSKVSHVPDTTSFDEDEDDRVRRLGLRFKVRDGLLYYINFNDGRERLCIPNSLEKHIFELAHDR